MHRKQGMSALKFVQGFGSVWTSKIIFRVKGESIRQKIWGYSTIQFYCAIDSGKYFSERRPQSFFKFILNAFYNPYIPLGFNSNTR